MWIYDHTALLKIREAQGRTQRDVCGEGKLDITQTTLRYWETGKQAPRADYLALLATVYGVNPNEFFKKK